MKKLLKAIGYLLGSILVIIVVLLAFLVEKDKSVASLKPLYTNSSSAFMPLMGMQVHYRDEGIATDSLPMILLHGMSSSLNTWDSVVLLLKDKKRLISLDLPAFGLTGPNLNNEYSFAFYNQFLDSFLNKLHINKCIIAGNSLGGAIAWHYSLAQPNKLAQLILVDAAGYSNKSAKGSLGFKIASTPVINNLLLYVTPKILVRKSLEGIYFNKNIVTDAQVERFHDMAISAGNRSAALTIFKKGFEKQPELINQISTPTLIIWGDQDQLIPVENAYEFQQNVKGSKLSILHNIGHVPMEETPIAFTEIIKSFIK